MAEPIYIKFAGLTEQPESRRVEVGYQWRRETKVFEGPYDIANNALPSIGQQLHGGYVTSSTLEPIKGGAARLIYTVEYRNTNAIFEVQFQQAQIPLERHPRYAPGGVKALSPSDLADIQQWKSAMISATHYIDQNGAVKPLSPNAQDFARKYLNGNDSYLVFAPVARKTTINWLALTVGSALGTYSSSPPFPGAPAGYKWLKIGDDATYDSGFWTRVESWAGYDSLDPDLYS